MIVAVDHCLLGTREMNELLDRVSSATKVSRISNSEVVLRLFTFMAIAAMKNRIASVTATNIVPPRPI